MADTVQTAQQHIDGYSFEGTAIDIAAQYREGGAKWSSSGVQAAYRIVTQTLHRAHFDCTWTRGETAAGDTGKNRPHRVWCSSDDYCKGDHAWSNPCRQGHNISQLTLHWLALCEIAERVDAVRGTKEGADGSWVWLDLGAGTGYMTVAMALLARDMGLQNVTIYAIDPDTIPMVESKFPHYDIASSGDETFTLTGDGNIQIRTLAKTWPCEVAAPIDIAHAGYMVSGDSLADVMPGVQYYIGPWDGTWVTAEAAAFADPPVVLPGVSYEKDLHGGGRAAGGRRWLRALLNRTYLRALT